ncbi:MAG: GTP-binding protein [Rhodospirillales bacterium]|nr:GTP-binding protein [Rhodospirillales bacterium]
MTARLNLLFGFLGSGKTTLARRLLDRSGTKEKTAIIVNEFGDVGIDGASLAGRHVDLIELTSGCLCCTLKGSLLNAVEELIARAGARRIVIEATGVAQPDELIETFADPSARARYDIGPIVTVVDSPKYSKLNELLGEFYRAQIENADVIILNKIDLAPAATLEDARREIARLSPRAEIHFADRCDVDLERLLDGPSSDVVRAHAGTRGDGRGGGNARGESGEHGHDRDHRHPPAESFVLDAGGDAARGAVESFFRKLPESVWRVKGFMEIEGRLSLIQYAMGTLEIRATDPRPARNMVFIGRDMNREEIAERFRAVRKDTGNNPALSRTASG